MRPTRSNRATQHKDSTTSSNETENLPDQASASWKNIAELTRSAWLKRPRLRSAAFQQDWLDTELEKLADAYNATIFDREAFDQKRRKQKHEIEEMVGSLAWSPVRLELFTQLVVSYSKRPNIQNYLRIRKEFPEVEIDVGRFGSLDLAFDLPQNIKNIGVGGNLVAGLLDAHEPSVDALCLRLLELIVQRENLPKTGAGYIAKRRSAVNDPAINYLISVALEAYEDIEARIPGSLIVLLRHQLCGENPDIDAEFRLRQRQVDVALAVAQSLKPDERLSINKLKQLAQIPRSTATRWLKDPHFKSWLQTGRKWAAEGVFEEGRRAFAKRMMSCVFHKKLFARQIQTVVATV